MLTVVELAFEAGVRAPEAHKVARFAGAFTPHDPRTGQLPKRWAGQGMDATFTEAEAAVILAEWERGVRFAAAGLYHAPNDPETIELAGRYALIAPEDLPA